MSWLFSAKPSVCFASFVAVFEIVPCSSDVVSTFFSASSFSDACGASEFSPSSSFLDFFFRRRLFDFLLADSCAASFSSSSVPPSVFVILGAGSVCVASDSLSAPADFASTSTSVPFFFFFLRFFFLDPPSLSGVGCFSSVVDGPGSFSASSSKSLSNTSRKARRLLLLTTCSPSSRYGAIFLSETYCLKVVSRAKRISSVVRP
mmetsp:Transcript_17421/g.36087  ORF Transcript_17421/g.36087 Transcript_17421/m.36087 type:complete len:204 (-) Transcript_17421:1202-1813(-)